MEGNNQYSGLFGSSNQNIFGFLGQQVPPVVVTNPTGFFNQGVNYVGFAKEVTSYLEGEPRQQKYGGFGGNANNSMFGGRQSEKKKEPIVRYTKLFTDENGPWKHAHEQVKNLYSAEEIQKSMFKFPQNVDKCFTVSELLEANPHNKFIFNACLAGSYTSWYRCYNCDRSQQKLKWRNQSYSFGICERCFEPSQHVGHYYVNKTETISHYNSEKLICICGKDMFLGNPPIYRCMNHCEAKDQDQSVVNKNREKWAEILQIFKSLFSITFYLQVEMYQFGDFSKEEAIPYFDTMKKIIKKLTQVARLDGDLMLEIYQFVSENKQTVKFDHYQESGSFFGRGGHQKFLSTTILNYFLKSFGRQPNFKDLLSIFLSNDSLAQNFQERIQANNKQDYVSLEEKIEKELRLRSNIVEKHLTKTTQGFWKCQQNQKIIWLKSQKNYQYAPKFIKSIIYSNKNSNHWRMAWNEYSNNMSTIVDAFNKINIGKFLRYIGPYLLPELLNCFHRIYINEEFSYNNQEEDANEDEKQSTRNAWKNNQDIIHGMITKIIISLCDGKVENLGRFKSILEEIQNNFKIDEQQIKYEGQQKKKLLKVQKIVDNFAQYYQSALAKFGSFYFNQSYSSSSNNNYGRNEEQLKKQYDRQQYEAEKRMRMLVGLFLSTSYQVSDKNSKADLAISNLCKIGNRSRFGGQSLSYRRNRDQVGKKVERSRVYMVLGLVLFYEFYLPELCCNGLKSEAQVAQHRRNLEQFLMHYLINKKTFTPHKIHILSKKLNLPNFTELVKNHLTYNFQTKKYFYNEAQLPQYPDLPIYQLLSDPSASAYDSVIGFSCVEKLQKYIKSGIQKEILYKIFVESGLIEEQKSFLDRVIEKFGKIQGEQHAQLFNHYVFYISYLIIGEVVERVSKKEKKVDSIIGSELKRLRQEEQYRYRFPMTDQQKHEIAELLFGKREKKEISVVQQKMEENVLKIPQTQTKQTKEQYLAKKEQKNKQFRQKRQKLLSSSEPAEQISPETCIICHQGPTQLNPLVYPMHVNVNKTVPTAFYPSANKMCTNIRSCFHPLHLNCYQKQNYTKCPLCSHICNCFITTKFSKENKKVNRMSFYSIIVALHNNYKIKDIENLFILLVKFLVEAKVFLAMINIQIYEMSKRKRQRAENFMLEYVTDMYRQASNELKVEYDESIASLKEELTKVEQQTLAKLQLVFLAAIHHKIQNNQANFDVDELTKLASKMRSSEFMVVKAEVEQLQPSLAEKLPINCDNEQKREVESISKEYPLQLPKDVRNLDKVGQPKCSLCQIKPKHSICLICGFALCQYCKYSSDHGGRHEEKALDFFFEEAKVKFSLSMSQEQSRLFCSRQSEKELCMYYNDFMIPYKEVLKNEKNLTNEIFTLNQVFYFGLTEMLLN